MEATYNATTKTIDFPGVSCSWNPWIKAGECEKEGLLGGNYVVISLPNGSLENVLLLYNVLNRVLDDLARLHHTSVIEAVGNGAQDLMVVIDGYLNPRSRLKEILAIIPTAGTLRVQDYEFPSQHLPILRVLQDAWKHLEPAKQTKALHRCIHARVGLKLLQHPFFDTAQMQAEARVFIMSVLLNQSSFLNAAIRSLGVHHDLFGVRHQERQMILDLLVEMSYN